MDGLHCHMTTSGQGVKLQLWEAIRFGGFVCFLLICLLNFVSGKLLKYGMGVTCSCLLFIQSKQKVNISDGRLEDGGEPTAESQQWDSVVDGNLEFVVEPVNSN